MDEDSKELIKAAAEVVLKPITSVVDNTIGVLGGDRLSAYRAANKHKWEEHYRAERTKITKETDTPDLRMAAEILGNAQDECRDELLKVWAKLMAGIVDASKSTKCRREFVKIAECLEPIDVKVLPLIDSQAILEPDRVAYVAEQLKIEHDQVNLAFRNLERLELVTNKSAGNSKLYPFTSPLGRQFLAVLR
jgi:hypothetical protein